MTPGEGGGREAPPRISVAVRFERGVQSREVGASVRAARIATQGFAQVADSLFEAAEPREQAWWRRTTASCWARTAGSYRLYIKGFFLIGAQEK